jgi:2-dehydro-3-deoxyphosphogluconate aldolase/(4S)-4-hydroxy-2-oxoglutarate aldolase
MTPADQSRRTAEIPRLAPVIPVLVIEVVAHARPLAEALVRGGLPALEVTLRTPAALDVIRAMAGVPGAAGAEGGCRRGN